MDILAHALKNNVFHEDLGSLGSGGDEDLGGLVAGIWRPLVGAGELNDLFPVRDGWEDLEGFGQLARFVAREKEADPVVVSKALGGK